MSASSSAPSAAARAAGQQRRRGTASRRTARPSVRACCSARISVGAISATCSPFSIATSAASSATMRLARRRRRPAAAASSAAGAACRRRCRATRVFWPAVSLNGSTARAARAAHRRRGTCGLRSASARRRRSATPVWKTKNSSKISRTCAGLRNRSAPRRRRPASGKCDGGSASRRAADRSRAHARRRAARRQHRAGSVAERLRDQRALDLRRQRADALVDRARCAVMLVTGRRYRPSARPAIGLAARRRAAEPAAGQRLVGEDLVLRARHLQRRRPVPPCRRAPPAGRRNTSLAGSAD